MTDEQLVVSAGAALMADKIKRFGELVGRHDLTYAFSDDHRVWAAGDESWRKIRAAARELPLEVVRKIWSAKVAASMKPEFRDMYEWKEN